MSHNGQWTDGDEPIGEYFDSDGNDITEEPMFNPQETLSWKEHPEIYKALGLNVPENKEE